VFGIARTPAPKAGLQELYEALEWVAPGFEIVQSHRPGWKFTAADTALDNGLHGRLLVGRPVAPRELAADGQALHERLARATAALQHDARKVDEGRGSNVLDSPLAALAYFLAELRACPGAPDLQAGDVITTGTWTDAWPVQPGQRWSARFSDPALGTLRVRFV
jgi:2-oxo-3-hexenedioate decarboxylase